MRRLVDISRLVRLVNCLMAMAGVWVGAYMTWIQPIYTGPLLAALATFCVCAAGNALNDLLDVKSDRINHPDRVLVKGTVPTTAALALVIGLDLLALVLALLVNMAVAAVVLIAIVLVTVYNLGGKHLTVVSNLVVGVLGALTFIVGGLAVDTVLTWELPGPLIPAVYALFFHFVREIIKDVQDIEGDKVVGGDSIAVTFGIRPALSTALALFTVLVVLTMIPVLTGWFSETYKVITIYAVDLPLMLLLIFLWGSPTPRMLSVGASALKVGMALGVVALLVA